MYNIKNKRKPLLTLGTTLPDYTAAHTAMFNFKLLVPE